MPMYVSGQGNHDDAAAMSATPMPFMGLIFSPRNKAASKIAKTTLSLSTGATCWTLPELKSDKIKKPGQSSCNTLNAIKPRAFLLAIMVEKLLNLPWTSTTMKRNTAIMTALRAVAVLVSIPFNPIWPNIATNAAVTVDSKANNSKQQPLIIYSISLLPIYCLIFLFCADRINPPFSSTLFSYEGDSSAKQRSGLTQTGIAQALWEKTDKIILSIVFVYHCH